jgi:hypothetical protein
MKTAKNLTLLVVFAALVVGTTSQVRHAEGQLRYDDEPLVMPGAEFVLEGRSWLPRTNLTYGFISITPDLGVATTKAAVAEAFALWAAAAPLTFAEVSDCGFPFDAVNCAIPDIRIQFAAGNHGDGFSFDGPVGILAHAFYPPPNGVSAAGDMHFDEADLWSDDLSVLGIDLVTVAAHEIGHALGLAHAEAAKCPSPTTGESSIMCPFYTGPRRFLAQDDIEAIQSVYGPLACVDDPGSLNFTGFANITCQMKRLSAEVFDATLANPLTKMLTKRLSTAQQRLNEARTSCTSGQTKKTITKLQAALRLLENFKKQVDIREGKGDIPTASAVSFRDATALILLQIEEKLSTPADCS